MYTPYGYQTACLTAIQAARQQGEKRALIVMASGLGKTITMAFDIKWFLEGGSGGRTLFLCHNNDLLYQAKTKFEAIIGPQASYGYLHGTERDLHYVDFLFASFQTMDQAKTLFRPDEFKYLAVDESHHGQAPTYRPTIEYFRPDFLLGATATPDRMDMKDIREIFGREVFSLPLEEAMAQGLVAPVDYRLLTDEIMLKNVLESDEGRKISLAELNRKIFVPRRDEEIAEIINRHIAGIPNPRVMVFAPTTRYCDHSATIIPGSFAIHYRTPRRERVVRIELFRQEIINKVITVNAFNEGLDIPNVNVLVFLRDTASRTVFLQQLGRGTRLSPGKEKFIVLDFVANCERIKLVYDFYQQVKAKTSQWHNEQKARSLMDSAGEPMRLNVKNVEFQEKIVPLLTLLERLRPMKIVEVPALAGEYAVRNPLPTDVAPAAYETKYWWTCTVCSFEWLAQVGRRLKGVGCPACTHRIVTAKNNLAVTHPELAKEYSSKNPLSATQVFAGTRQKLWWKCPICEHEWRAKGSSRSSTNQTGCPACTGKWKYGVVTAENNLAVLFPALAQEYSSRNKLPATKVLPIAKKRFWWRCQDRYCRYEWQSVASERIRNNTGCPNCARRKR